MGVYIRLLLKDCLHQFYLFIFGVQVQQCVQRVCAVAHPVLHLRHCLFLFCRINHPLWWLDALCPCLGDAALQHVWVEDLSLRICVAPFGAMVRCDP